MITPPIDPGFSLWPAALLPGGIAGGRQMLHAEQRRGNRLSAWISASVFLQLTFSAPLDLGELLRGTT